jgi:iron-sulfur cluster repair protein YtfE (RIC family)
MNVDTDQFRDTHTSLREQIAILCETARELPKLSARERSDRRGELLTFLRTVIEPHTRIDERILYPEIAFRLGDALATASMSYDHLAIRNWIDKIEAAGVDEPEELQELLYGLDALIRVHLWKENELYLTMLDSPSWPGGS